MSNNTQRPEGYAPFDLYPYNPSQGPAYAFLGLFGAAGIAHFIMMFPYRSAFPIPMMIGCGMEAAAYWFRSQSHDNLRQTLPFLLRPCGPAIPRCHDLHVPRPHHESSQSTRSIAYKPTMDHQVTAGAIMSGSEDLDEAKRG
ncbi:RTA1 like domain-containing protein [Fusarium phyllophilum]|uniref:RTA1 like domain-containing protein n=1 Tax=Fusarium phyllophilum TaxID=47803 RepID=A0A8H5I4V8_9HYPO|nr:RTA1 like domain-containing protein [Fusarium phyllophilum]